MTDFYEEDEPVESLVVAFEAGPQVATKKMPKPCLSCQLEEHEACAQLFCNCAVCDHQ